MKKLESLSIIFFLSSLFVLFADASIHAQVPIGFMSCSKGEERCKFEGTKEVFYGDGTQTGKYLKKTATDFIDCTNATFGGDPAPNVSKKCFIPYPGSPENSPNFFLCGKEGELCQFLSQRKVMYGAGDQWAITVATNGVDCSVRVFMDPAPNVFKKCYASSDLFGAVPPVTQTITPPPQTQGMTRQQLEDEFSNSFEARQFGPSTDQSFTVSLYWRYLGHGPDGNVNFHTARITNRQITRLQLEDEFRTSTEAVQHGASTNIDFTTSLYWRYLGHAPDGNLQFHANRLSAGQLTPVSLPPTPIQSVPNQGSNADVQFWDAVKNSQRAQDFQSYLSAFPNGQFTALARFKMNQLAPAAVIPTTTAPTSGNASADEQFWNSVRDSQRAQDFQSYLSAFPNGQFAALARFKMNQLAAVFTPTTPSTGGVSIDEQFWNNVKNSSNPRDFQSYLDNFPNGQFAALARFNRDRLGGAGAPVSPPTTVTKPTVTGFQQVIAAAQPGSISEIARARKFFVVSNDFSIKSKITSAILKELPQMQAASTEQEADFLIGFELTDRTTGLVTANDKGNPNLRGELIVFTTIPATNNRPESIRILFRVTKERGFGVFSATPDENAAKEFAKQFAKVII